MKLIFLQSGVTEENTALNPAGWHEPVALEDIRLMRQQADSPEVKEAIRQAVLNAILEQAIA